MAHHVVGSCDPCCGSTTVTPTEICGCIVSGILIEVDGYTDCVIEHPGEFPDYEHIEYSSLNRSYILLPEYDEFGDLTGFGLTLGIANDCGHRGLEYDYLETTGPPGSIWPYYDYGYLYRVEGQMNCVGVDGDGIHVSGSITALTHNMHIDVNGGCSSDAGGNGGETKDFTAVLTGCDEWIYPTLPPYWPAAGICDDNIPPPTLRLKMIV